MSNTESVVIKPNQTKLFYIQSIFRIPIGSDTMSDSNNLPLEDQQEESACAEIDENIAADADSIPKCSICLDSFSDQQIGVLNPCKHNFCWECIREWSESRQTCPIDRSSFSQILIHSQYNDGAIVRTVDVEKRVSNAMLGESIDFR